MKATVEIADALLLEARNMAAARHTTLRQIVEEGLRALINVQRTSGFRLPDESFGGEGMQKHDWAEVRKAIYEGRGE